MWAFMLNVTDRLLLESRHYRTERVIYACLGVACYVVSHHPESSPLTIEALPWLAGVVAGRSFGAQAAPAVATVITAMTRRPGTPATSLPDEGTDPGRPR